MRERTNGSSRPERGGATVVDRRGADAAASLTVMLFDGADATCVDDLDAAPSKLAASQLLWVDLDDPDEETLGRVVDHFGIDETTAARLAAPERAPFLRDTAESLQVSVSTPTSDQGDRLMAVDCVISNRWVVTLHAGPAAVLDEFKERAGGSGATGELDGPGFLATLVEWMLTEYAVAFEQVEQELEEFDARAMRGGKAAEQEIEYLIEVRNRVGTLRRSLTAHRVPLVALAHPAFVGFNEEDSERFRLVLERFEATLQGARDARESTVNSFDVLIARTSHRTNEIMKILTLASVIFLPGALIAGIMGMNFNVGLFNHPALFWVAITIMATIAIVTLSIAKLRDWI